VSSAAQMSQIEFLKRTFIIVAVALIPFLIWYLFGVVLMAFGAVILAMLLRLIAEPLVRWLKVPGPLALIVSALIVIGVVLGAGYLFGSQITSQFQDVVRRAESARADIHAYLQGSDFGKFVLNQISGSTFSVTEIFSGVLKVSSSFLEAVIIMIVTGIYLAAQPRVYRDGLVWLFPPRAHRRAAEVIDEIGHAQRLWLIGQLIEMVLIGALSALAVWSIGVPSPLALGLIAGIGQFIPYVGPLLAAIPAILVALTKSPEGGTVDAVRLPGHPSDRGQYRRPADPAPHGVHSASGDAARHHRHHLFVRPGRDHFCRAHRGRYLCRRNSDLCARYTWRENRVDAKAALRFGGGLHAGPRHAEVLR
jgi:predicted PurR-regulated permease PerM